MENPRDSRGRAGEGGGGGVNRKRPKPYVLSKLKIDYFYIRSRPRRFL